ncbi:MAG: cytochrome-c peroxidase [Chlorobi bacterium]|nr:cytochrome-c peroxidase [Chlorobiota bacterium]
MKKLSALLILVLFSAMLIVSCGESKQKVDKMKIMTYAKKMFAPLPKTMPGSENDTPERIALGKKLYFDTRLSVNDEQSCNTCHLLDEGKAGVDNLPTSPGALGKNGVRNSPTVLNAGFHFVQFWDGRAKDLFAQAKGPILNPIEMAMPDSAAVEKKIGAIDEYKEAFAKAFPDDGKVSFDNIAEAIAAFERTLITKDRFDNFLKGNPAALTETEAEGLDVFIKRGCTTCHAGALLGGNMFQKMGFYQAYKDTTDKGRYDVTKNEADMYMFKVPSLRNVAFTAPYFHDGQVAALTEAITEMSRMQLQEPLTEEEVVKVAAFLGSLSDKDIVKANKKAAKK